VTQESAYNLWIFAWNFWQFESSSFMTFLVNVLNKIVTRLTLHCEHLFADPSLNIPRHCLAVPSTDYILAVKCAQFNMDLGSTRVFSMKKTDNSANFAAEPIKTHSVERRTSPVWQVMWSVRKWLMLFYFACTSSTPVPTFSGFWNSPPSSGI
jgi:hypothetical protein